MDRPFVRPSIRKDPKKGTRIETVRFYLVAVRTWYEYMRVSEYVSIPTSE
jgi:hypothetical protein